VVCFCGVDLSLISLLILGIIFALVCAVGDVVI
jgi:hypothetical protein